MAARKKTGPTPARPRIAGAPPVAPPEPQPVLLEDGTEVVFSFSQWLTDRGLTASKPVEVGGRVFQFRAAGSTVDNALLLQHMMTGKYKEAVELMLVDPAEVDAVLAGLVLPFAQDEEQKLWGAFTRAISGVTVGESSAS